MNDLIEFLEMVSLKNAGLENMIGSSIDNADIIPLALANASPHIETMMEAVLKSGVLNLMS